MPTKREQQSQSTHSELPLDQTPLVDDTPPASERDEEMVAQQEHNGDRLHAEERTAEEDARQRNSDHLTRPTGNTTVEPVPGSEGPRSQLDLDNKRW